MPGAVSRCWGWQDVEYVGIFVLLLSSSWHVCFWVLSGKRFWATWASALPQYGQCYVFRQIWFWSTHLKTSMARPGIKPRHPDYTDLCHSYKVVLLLAANCCNQGFKKKRKKKSSTLPDKLHYRSVEVWEEDVSTTDIWASELIQAHGNWWKDSHRLKKALAQTLTEQWFPSLTRRKWAIPRERGSCWHFYKKTSANTILQRTLWTNLSLLWH